VIQHSLSQSSSKVPKSKVCILLAAVLFLGSLAGAQTLTGVVTNSTTGKPAAGDEIVLLKLGQGMEEAGRTKTNAKGEFSFKLAETQSPHLVRAIHQNVTYHRMAPPGTTSVAVEVYDVAKKVEGVEVVADVMHVAAENGTLEVYREFGVQNASKPPRTQMNDHNLEFYVPAGAQIVADSGSATTENGNPLKSAPVPQSEKDKYSFVFPLRPGLTRFEVTYQLPYNGTASLEPKSLYPLEHFVVMLPKSMQFSATSGDFKLTSYPEEPGANVQVASNTTPSQNLAFKLSGEGKLEPSQQNGAQGASAGEEGSPQNSDDAQSGNRPGGGLGPPIDAPDPLQKYRWWILGGFAGVLVVGGVFIASRQQAAARSLRSQMAGRAASAIQEGDEYEGSEILAMGASGGRGRPRSMLMEGIKEELFQLEIERKQGQISHAEYDEAKAAIDLTLARALKRQARV
jgi:hypothetical protein